MYWMNFHRTIGKKPKELFPAQIPTELSSIAEFLNFPELSPAASFQTKTAKEVHDSLFAPSHGDEATRDEFIKQLKEDLPRINAAYYNGKAFCTTNGFTLTNEQAQLYIHSPSTFLAICYYITQGMHNALGVALANIKHHITDDMQLTPTEEKTYDYSRLYCRKNPTLIICCVISNRLINCHADGTNTETKTQLLTLQWDVRICIPDTLRTTTGSCMFNNFLLVESCNVTSRTYQINPNITDLVTIRMLKEIAEEYYFKDN